MVSPSSTDIMLPGAVDVTSFMSDLPMYSAHRGGSLDWPEHSLRAYTQAVFNGYPCLEVSLARTSDGVYVCNHDASINAVVWGGISGLPDISAMTWSTLSTYMLAGPVKHRERGPEPILRFTDLLDAYGDSHVFMVDPKSVSTSNYSELLDLLDSRGGPSRFIGKWVGSNLTWSNALKARSYESWGAFFSSDWTTGSGFNTSWADQWSMLGLNYDASQAHWTEILATGKKIIAHICPDEAAVATAKAKGASGFQVSGIESVTPIRVPDPPVVDVSVGYDDLPAGMAITVNHDGTNWPVRPTSRTDLVVWWVGPDTIPAGILPGDVRLVVAA